MTLRPIEPKPQPKQLSMGMKYTRKVIPRTEVANCVVDKIKLDNGKSVEVTTEYFENKPLNKLLYLKDKLGNWVKSKLVFFDGMGKRRYTKISNKGEIK